MYVAVMGRSDINDILSCRLSEEGFSPVVFANIDEVSAISGQIGDFDIRVGESSIKAGCIVITEQKTGRTDSRDAKKRNAPCISLLDVMKTDTLAGMKGQVAFLTDYPAESPGFMTRIALEKAIRLAGKKRKVLYLSRFMRTAGEGLEDLYTKARESGITFIKYEDIDFEYRVDGNSFRLKVTDQYGSIDIGAAVLITADETAAGEKEDRAAGLLRLKADSKGNIDNDEYFLYPVLTSRKGVYMLSLSNGEATDKDLHTAINHVIRDIRKELAGSGSLKHADVDKSKCAFCYTCYRACPHAAMTQDFENSAMKNLEDACFACGICVSLCPAQAIEIVEKGSAEIEAADMTAAVNTLKVFCCENSAGIALKKIVSRSGGIFDRISVSNISCGGDISAYTIITALKEYEKVLVAVCVDEACRHFEGNRRAKLQVERVGRMLSSAGLDSGRVEFVQVSGAMPEVIGSHIQSIV